MSTSQHQIASDPEPAEGGSDDESLRRSSARREPVADLQLRREDDAGRVYVAVSAAGPALVGRDVVCAVRLHDPSGSRCHAVLVPRGEWWIVRDLGSRNGTFLNGRRLPPGYPVVLSGGACLAFGRSEEFRVIVRGGRPDPDVLPTQGPRAEADRWRTDPPFEDL